MVKFYKKTNTTYDTELNSTFRDLFYGNGTTATISSTQNERFYLSSHTVAEAPSYGGGELIGLLSGIMFSAKPTAPTDSGPVINTFFVNTELSSEGSVDFESYDLTTLSSAPNNVILFSEDFDSWLEGDETAHIMPTGDLRVNKGPYFNADWFWDYGGVNLTSTPKNTTRANNSIGMTRDNFDTYFVWETEQGEKVVSISTDPSAAPGVVDWWEETINWVRSGWRKFANFFNFLEKKMFCRFALDPKLSNFS